MRSLTYVRSQPIKLALLGSQATRKTKSTPGGDIEENDGENEENKGERKDNKEESTKTTSKKHKDSRGEVQ